MKTFILPLKPESVIIFLTLMAGILLGNVFPESKRIIQVVLALLTVCTGLSWVLRFRLTFFLILLMTLCSGVLLIQSKIYPDIPDSHISLHLDKKKSLISGKIISFADHYKKKQRVILQCRSIETDEKVTKSVSGKIYLSLYGTGKSNPKFGDIVEFESTIKSIHNFQNPNGFDYQRFLRLQGIFGTAYTYINRVKIKTQNDHISGFTRIARAIEDLRNRYYFTVLKRTRHSNAGKILVSLITGKKQILPADIRDLFSKAGISHLLAISGLHLSIAGFLFYIVFYFFFSWIPILMISGQSKKIAGILTLIPLLGYTVLSGFSPSSQRAFLMALVFLFSHVSEKEGDILSSLSMAGILILLFDASALFSVSFQLSFMAVIFIISGISLLKTFPWIISVFSSPNKILSKTALTLMVTFFAGLGTFPLTAHYFHMVSHVQLLSNLIAIPLMGFIVLPLGLLSLLLLSFLPELSIIFISLCTQLINPVILFCKFLISIPFSWSRIISLSGIETVIIYLFIITVFFFLQKKRKAALLFLSAAVLISFSFFYWNTPHDISDRTLGITVLDIGQGNSALIETPRGKRILVDGGGFSDTASFDTGRYIIAPFLWQNGIRILDYVILSHPESDHLNGLLYILDNFVVPVLIKNDDIKASSSYQKLMALCEKKNIRIINPLTTMEKFDFGGINLTFFKSFKDTNAKNFNNNSLVFRIEFNRFSMLFPGDILASREKHLSLLKDSVLLSDILLSPHHGSSTSSSKFFLDKVQPKSVIISCGRRNRYGFPHPEVLKRYQDRNAGIYRTDEKGAVFIRSDGKTYNITSQ